MKRAEVYSLIDSERDYQDEVWANSGGGDGVLSVGEQILLLEEYVTKARLAWTKELAPELTALDIMRKIAGIAVHCMEDHGGCRRKGY